MVIHCKYDKLIPINEVNPSPFQTNKHPREQIERLAKILKYQGVRRPGTWSNQTETLAVGHGMKEAFILNGWTEFPVVYQDFEDEDQERAHVTSDNAIAAWAEIDLALVNAQIEHFNPNFDIEMLGVESFTLDPADKFSDPPDMPSRSDGEPTKVHECPRCGYEFR